MMFSFDQTENKLPIMLDLKLIEDKLKPLTEWHSIPVTSSRFYPGSTGRFGFHIEALFDIPANNSRKPDKDGHEYKTVLVSNNLVKSICIGTVPKDEYRKIKNQPTSFFEFSQPGKKMSQTLYIFYEKSYLDDTQIYRVLGYNHVKLNNLFEPIKQQLDRDFQTLVNSFKRYSYEDLSRSGPVHGNTKYLKLSYKGDQSYTYPCWSFKKSLIQKIYDNSIRINPTM